MKMMKMKMTNKELKPDSALDSLFIYQEEFQKILGYENVPFDDPIMMKQHILGLVGEIGEVLQADQRWKDNSRNEYYNREEKMMEIADCLIYLINVCLYSGINASELYISTVNKINKNFKRFKK